MRPDDAGPDATFDAVRESMASWQPSVEADRGFAVAVRDHLDRELNRGVDSPWEREAVELHGRSYACDVIVNGVIGVWIVDELTPHRLRELRIQMRGLADEYEYVLFVAHHLAGSDTDAWRVLERHNDAAALGLSGLDFQRVDRRVEGRDRPTLAPTVRRLAPAVVLILLAIGAAVGVSNVLSSLEAQGELFTLFVAGNAALAALVVTVYVLLT